MRPEDHIRYDILAQEAMRGVMRKVLGEVSRTGLPGNHHFFITFLTGAPGVRISTRLRERYPEQMTIVLQYQYWDLKVTDTGFEIGLSFSDIPEKLEIPFAAVRGFYDPSVNFELEFDVKPVVEDARGIGRSGGLGRTLGEAPNDRWCPARHIAGRRTAQGSGPGWQGRRDRTSPRRKRAEQKLARKWSHSTPSARNSVRQWPTSSIFGPHESASSAPGARGRGCRAEPRRCMARSLAAGDTRGAKPRPSMIGEDSTIIAGPVAQ
jgi:hypothetical protein